MTKLNLTWQSNWVEGRLKPAQITIVGGFLWQDFLPGRSTRTIKLYTTRHTIIIFNIRRKQCVCVV